MTVLKIIGITLSVIVLLILIILLLRIKFLLCFKKGEKVKFAVKILCFTFGNKDKKPKEESKKEKKEKKPNKLIEKIKKKLGLDIELSDEKENGGISDTVNKVVTLITLLAGQLKWLLTKFRLDKLRIFVLCSGGDAAEAAMDYGAVCATIYPLVGYLMGNINAKENAEDIQIGCDFDGGSHFEFDLTVSVMIFYIVKALISGLFEMAENTAIIEEAKNEQQ